jgi:hypothetical protein
MTERQAVIYFGAYLWKRERLGIIFTFLFAIYIGATISFSVDGFFGKEEIPRTLYGLIDWIYLTMFPVFGLVMNKSAFGMWRDDYYSKRLAHWRTMPIPIASIVQARFLQSFITLPIVGVVFIFLQYAIAPHLREAVSLAQWLENGVVWLAYAFIVNALYVWLELGFSGKKYVLYYLGFMGLTAILSAVLTWQGIYLFQEALRLIEEGYGAALIVGLAVAAIAATWIGHRATVRRIRRRSMTFKLRLRIEVR